MKRFVAMVLALVLLFSIMPIDGEQVFAESNGFNGAEDYDPSNMIRNDPNEEDLNLNRQTNTVTNDRTYTVIYNAEDLNNIRRNLSGNYILATDIDLSGVTWEPIGDNAAPFTGKLDGNGHVVSNMAVIYNGSETYYGGLIGVASEASICNLGVVNSYVSVTVDNVNTVFAFASGVVGASRSGTVVQNCFFVGTSLAKGTKNAYARAAGISVECENAEVRNCFSYATIDASADYKNTMAGGISAWLNNSKAINCYSAGNIIAKNTNSYTYAGGIAASGGSGTIKSCVVLADRIYGTGKGTYIDAVSRLATNTDCRVINTLTGNASNNYTKISSDDAKLASTYTSIGWDFSTVWKTGDPYPQLYFNRAWSSYLGFSERSGDLPIYVCAIDSATNEYVAVEGAVATLYIGSTAVRTSNPTGSDGITTISLEGLTTAQLSRATVSAKKLVSQGMAETGSSRDALYNSLYPKDTSGNPYRYSLELHSEWIDSQGNWRGDRLPITGTCTLRLSEPRLHLNMSVCYYADDSYSQSASYQASVKETLKIYSELLAEASDGHIFIDKFILYSTNNRRNFYNTGNIASMADIRIESKQNEMANSKDRAVIWANSYAGGFYGSYSFQTNEDYFEDYFTNDVSQLVSSEYPSTHFRIITSASGVNGGDVITNQRRFALTLVHETGHYVMSVLDEYLDAGGNKWKKSNRPYENYGLMDWQYSDHELSKSGIDYSYLESWTENKPQHTAQSWSRAMSCEETLAQLLTRGQFYVRAEDNTISSLCRCYFDQDYFTYKITYTKAENHDFTALFPYGRRSDSDFIVSNAQQNQKSNRNSEDATTTETTVPLGILSFSAEEDTVVIRLQPQIGESHELLCQQENGAFYRVEQVAGEYRIQGSETSSFELRLLAILDGAYVYNTYYVRLDQNVSEGMILESPDRRILSYLLNEEDVSYLTAANNTDYRYNEYYSVSQAMWVSADTPDRITGGELYTAVPCAEEIDYSSISWFLYRDGTWQELPSSFTTEENLNLGVHAEIVGQGMYVVMAKQPQSNQLMAAASVCAECVSNREGVVKISFDDPNDSAKYYRIYYSETPFDGTDTQNINCVTRIAGSSEYYVDVACRDVTRYLAVEILGENGEKSSLSELVSIYVAAADSDSDGIPDWYCDEYQLWGDSEKDIANSDDDGDGATNLEEYLAGTNPAQADPIYIEIVHVPLLTKDSVDRITDMEVRVVYGDGSAELIDDYTIVGYNPYSPGLQEITVTWNDLQTSATIMVYRRQIADVTIEAIPDQLFSLDSPCQPTITAYYSDPSDPLVYNQDYTVIYRDNDSPGFAKCILSGKGWYEGEIEVEFVIYCDHDVVAISAVAPTCTEPGLTEGSHCSVCGVTLVEQTVVAPLGHNYVDGVCQNCGDQLSSFTATFLVPDNVMAPEPVTIWEIEQVTLPTADAPDGFSFVGWSLSPVQRTTVAPECHYSGEAMSLSNDCCFYALYTQTETDGTDPTFELVDEAPSDWSGFYVITYGTSQENMCLLKGVIPAYDGAEIESVDNCASYAGSGASMNGATLTDVSFNYVFELIPRGNYYSVQNVATKTYLGVSTNSYLAGYTSFDSSFCNWTPGIGDNISGLKNAADGNYQYPYVNYYANGGYFWTNSQLDNSIRFWKETAGVSIYFTTDPDEVVPHEHAYNTWTSVGNGHHCRVCTICRMSEAELCSAAVVPELPATCTDAGLTEGSYCSICNATLIEQTPIEPLGHSYETTTIAPTQTEQGYDEHACTRCGNSYRDNYVDALGVEKDEALKIKTASISLQSDLSINYYVADSVLEGWSEPYLVLNKALYDASGNITGCEVETVTEFTLKTAADGTPCHVFRFAGIAAFEMGSNITATIYGTKISDGLLYEGKTVNYSVLTYATNQLKKTTDAKLRTLLVDLLNYGAAAQTFWNYNTANLANANLTTEQQGYATAENPQLTNYREMIKNDGATVSFKTCSLSLKEKVTINYYLNLSAYTGDVNDLELHISYVDTDGITRTAVIDSAEFEYKQHTDGNYYYVANFSGLNAIQMRTICTAEVFSKASGERISNTVIYSIESYAYSKATPEGTSLSNLVYAMMKYGDSTNAYFVQ